MPLYEYHCLSCDLIFEELAALSEATKKKPCPECARKAPRTVSAFAIASGGSGYHDTEAVPVTTAPRDSRPLCMRYSGIPLSCHMDEPSLKRFVAHAKGRGAEYDDKKAIASEVRKQRGIPEPTYAQPSHGHDHDHGHERNPRRHAITQTNGHGHGHDHGHSHGHSKKKEKTSHPHTHGVHAH